MTRDKQFRNRKGIRGGVRNWKHAKTMAHIQFRKQFFMSTRQACLYWEEQLSIYEFRSGAMSKWLRWRKKQ